MRRCACATHILQLLLDLVDHLQQLLLLGACVRFGDCGRRRYTTALARLRVVLGADAATTCKQDTGLGLG